MDVIANGIPKKSQSMNSDPPQALPDMAIS
jgi:hypothetical protein